MPEPTPLKLAIFASGEGTTLEAIANACANSELNAQVSLVIGNNRDSGALRRARELALPHAHLSALTHPEPEALDAAMLAALLDAKIDLIVLAGYMKKIGPQLLAVFDRKIVNTHPALLPKFGGHGMYGRRVHEAVLAANERVTGVSVHWVTANYDEGEVIAQCEVPVLQGDTVESLAARVQHVERTFLVDTLRQIARRFGT